MLFAFLLTVPLTARFDETIGLRQVVYFATLMSTAVAMRRLRFRPGAKADIAPESHRLTLGASPSPASSSRAPPC